MIQVYIYIIIEAKSVVKVSVVNSNQKCNANQSRGNTKQTTTIQKN